LADQKNSSSSLAQMRGRIYHFINFARTLLAGTVLFFNCSIYFHEYNQKYYSKYDARFATIAGGDPEAES